ncbi:MAG: hypothetical protein ACLU9S_06685 [Oscillospiraceae bacterium]
MTTTHKFCSDCACEAVAALRRQGHLAILNTGRPHSHIDPRVLALTWDGFVCGCGMEGSRPGPESSTRRCRIPLCVAGAGPGPGLWPGRPLRSHQRHDSGRNSPLGAQVELEAQRMAAKASP